MSRTRPEAVGPVMAVAGEAADALAIPAHHQPVAVMFDFVDPQRAGRPHRLRRQTWFDEAGGTPHDHGRTATTAAPPARRRGGSSTAAVGLRRSRPRLDRAAGGALGDAQKEKAGGEAGGFTALTLPTEGGVFHRKVAGGSEPWARAAPPTEACWLMLTRRREKS